MQIGGKGQQIALCRSAVCHTTDRIRERNKGNLPSRYNARCGVHSGRRLCDTSDSGL